MNITFSEKKLINSFVREQEVACLEYVSCHILQLLRMFHVQGPETVRFELGLAGSEYDDLWLRILDVLMDHFALQQLHEQQKEHVKELFGKFRKAFSVPIF